MLGNKGKLGQKDSLETRQKKSLAGKGKIMSVEWRENLSKSRKGMKFSEEHKAKLREARKKLFDSGYKTYNWIEDRTQIKRQDRHDNPLYKEWRARVWNRDDFKCKIADKNCKGRIEAHHILAYRDFPELRFEINNGITLCQAHHPKKRQKEQELAPIFTELVKGENDFGRE